MMLYPELGGFSNTRIVTVELDDSPSHSNSKLASWEARVRVRDTVTGTDGPGELVDKGFEKVLLELGLGVGGEDSQSFGIGH